MSKFETKAVTINIVGHPSADNLEIAQIDGYQSIVRKGEYYSGQKLVYIPEQAIVPDNILDEMNLRGKLAGKDGNRVKAIRLRGVVSQGLLYDPGFALEEDRDYADTLGIKKWEPPIPIGFSGKLISCPSIPSYTEIENVKKYPDILIEGEDVVITEKLHGTLGIFHFDVEKDKFFVSSKGIAKNFHAAIEEDNQNVYWRAARKYNIEEKIRDVIFVQKDVMKFYTSDLKTVTIFGEVIGVQDLKYGLSGGNVELNIFDMRINHEYLSFEEFVCTLEADLDLPLVPIIYEGPYSKDLTWKLASGKEQFSGNELHIREGVVVKPTIERYDPVLGRVILKFVSDDYLLRNNKDATEYE